MDPLFELIANYIYEDKVGKPIGIDGRLRFNFFLDLLSAVHNEHLLNALAKIFIEKMAQSYNLNDISGIVCPKYGNVLFGNRIARFLNIKSGFVRRDILFGKWIEGDVYSGDKVLLVDDIASDGEMLVEAVYNLRKEGIYVEQVLVLVDRSEGDSYTCLKEENIDYIFFYQLSDEELNKIKHKQFL